MFFPGDSGELSLGNSMDGGRGFATAGLASIGACFAPCLLAMRASMKSVARTLTYLGLAVLPAVDELIVLACDAEFFLARHQGTSREMRLREASLMLIAALADDWREREDGDRPSEPLGLRVRSRSVSVEVVEACDDLRRKRKGVSEDEMGDESRENLEPVNDPFFTILCC